jgi:phosphatidyl-myo-inositol alpha-mannosyltransferase
MKIGLVCPYSIAYGGGVKEHVFAVRNELVRRGHDVYIITPQPRDYNPPKEDDHILLVGTATDFNSPLHTTVQLSAADNQAIDTILDEHQFDVIHFHEPWVPVLSRQLLGRSRSANVATFHAMLPETMMTRTLVKVVTPYTKSVLKYIDAYTAASDGAARYIRSMIDSPVAIVPNGVDVALYRPPATHHDKRRNKIIFYVGRLEGRKGVKYLIPAFKLLSEQDPNVRLVIGGNGPDREKLESLTRDLGIEDRVDFKGFISTEEKVKLLRTADLFCAPSIYGESFGIVLLEAMACGLVTVAGDNPGYAAVMKGLGALSLVNPKHTAEFARRLNLLLHEVDLRKIWRQWAEEQIPQYHFKTIVDQYETVYRKAIENRAARPVE